MTPLETAKAVLANASLIDPSFGNPDVNMLRKWAQILGDVDPRDALRAVDDHYSRPQPPRLMVGDVLDGAKRIQRERIIAQREAQTVREIEAAKSAGADHQAFEKYVKPVIEKITGRTVAAQAAERDAREVPCRHCKAQPGMPCTVYSGKPKDVAHPTRYDDAGVAAPKPGARRSA